MSSELTERQWEVMALLAEGNRHKEAADKLGLHTRTVDAHVQAAMRKLSSRTPCEAVAKLARQGAV